MNKNIKFLLIIVLLASTYPKPTNASFWSFIKRAALHFVREVLEDIIDAILPRDKYGSIINGYNSNDENEAAAAREKAIDQALVNISQELRDLTRQIDAQFASVVKDLKLNPLIELMAEQEAQIDHFKALIRSSSSFANFPQLIDTFIENYKNLNIESKMVNLIDAQTPGTDSLITAMVRAFKTEATNLSFGVKSSPNRLIYDFYMSVYFSVYRGYYFIQSGVITKDFGMLTFFEEDHEYFQSLTAIQIEKLTASMQATAKTFGFDLTHQLSYVDLSNNTAFALCREFHSIYCGLIKARKGYVITGVRYKIHNNDTLFIQIQEGQLIDHGQINATTVQWRDPPEDIDVNVVGIDCAGRFNYVPDKNYFDSAVLTGIQILYQGAASNYFIAIYGHEIVDYNEGIMNDTIITKVMNATQPPVPDNAPPTWIPSFISYDIEFDVKAPLCGIEMMRYGNPANQGNAVYKLRLMSLDALKFINSTDIGESIERQMTEFTKNSIISLINERKAQTGRSWPVIVAIVCGVIGAVLVAVAVILGMKKYLRGSNYNELR